MRKMLKAHRTRTAQTQTVTRAHKQPVVKSEISMLLKILHTVARKLIPQNSMSKKYENHTKKVFHKDPKIISFISFISFKLITYSPTPQEMLLCRGYM